MTVYSVRECSCATIASVFHTALGRNYRANRVKDVTRGGGGKGTVFKGAMRGWRRMTYSMTQERRNSIFRNFIPDFSVFPPMKAFPRASLPEGAQQKAQAAVLYRDLIWMCGGGYQCSTSGKTGSSKTCFTHNPRANVWSSAASSGGFRGGRGALAGGGFGRGDENLYPPLAASMTIGRQLLRPNRPRRLHVRYWWLFDVYVPDSRTHDTLTRTLHSKES